MCRKIRYLVAILSPFFLLALVAGCKEKTSDASEGKQRQKKQETPIEVRGNEYMTEIYKKVKSKYSMPDKIPENEKWGLRAKVVMRLRPTGEIKNLELERSSGNRLFDEACMKAVRTAAPFGKPPDELADRYETEGIGFDFDGR